MSTFDLRVGDALERLRALPADSVQCETRARGVTPHLWLAAGGAR